MALHGVRSIASVQVFQAYRHLGSLGQTRKLLEPLDAVFNAFIARDLAAGGVFGVSPFVTGKSDHIGESRYCGILYGFGHAFDDLTMIGLIIEPLDEWGAGHSVGSQDAGDAVLLEGSPILEGDDFNRIATEFAGNFAQTVDRPKVAASLITPADDRLTNIFL